ncbi:MAG: tetratricopeptide repeat protein, partial [Lentisphaeria bacterium]|nr:tetratricopeptide repeat protein [Lentisphaeria bacterium]
MKFFSRIILIFLAGVIFLTPAASGAENSGSEDLRMGDKAFENGDYDSAVRFFKKALVLLGSPLWEQCALKLGKAYLKCGDIFSAGEILNRLQQRSPKFSTGVLPGMILAAEGNFAEAVKAFGKVASQNGPERLEALYQQGLACLNTGAYSDALKAFEELDNSPVPEISRKGRYARIYTLIHSGSYDKADELLDKTASSPEREHLNMFNQIKRGNLAGFKVLWSKAREQSGDPRPEKLLYEICRTAADLSEQKQDAEFAAICLTDSFKFAPGNAERKDVMHQLFNLQSRSDTDGARETVNRYCAAFPDAS